MIFNNSDIILKGFFLNFADFGDIIIPFSPLVSKPPETIVFISYIHVLTPQPIGIWLPFDFQKLY